MKKRQIITTFVLSGLLYLVCEGQSLGQKLDDTLLFVTSYLKNPTQVGSVFPSSHALAQTITRQIVDDKAPFEKRRLLEVGGGEGAFTEVIINKMGPRDKLDVIEIDENLSKRLVEKFKCNDRVKVHCVSILDWNPSYKYDCIVSGLPFNSFESEMVAAIFSTYDRLAKKSSKLSFFEYRVLPELKKFFLRGEVKERFKRTRSVVEARLKKQRIATDYVNLNFPPAAVYHLKLNGPATVAISA